MFPKVHAGMEMDMVKDCGKNGGNAFEAFADFCRKNETISGFGLEHGVDRRTDDPRRVIHALKVGLSLTLVSLLYLIQPLFVGIGQNAIWAVMTVVLCLSSLQNYDYGIVIFLLTFNLITVSSYRVENVLKIAHERFYTIAIGCGICLMMSLLVFPNWSGEELHNSTVFKLEGLARAIEACVNEYFREETELNQDKSTEDPIYEGYKAVLDSKSLDETMALHASWEPRHSRHCHRFPWQRYVKLGNVLRHFGYTIVALHGCLGTEIQTPRSVRLLFKDPCIRLAGEVSKALMELSNSMRNRRHCSPEILSDHLHEALQDLNTAIKSQPRLFLGSNSNQATNMLALAAAHATQQKQGVSLSSVKTDSSALLEWKTKRANEQAKEPERKFLRPQLSKIAITSLEFSEALPFAAFASLLVETVAKLDHVIEEVEELGRIACFKEYEHGDENIVVTYERPPVNPIQNHLPSHGAD
ncbi:hypothetical protein DVH24_015649 [Malus domestica]|uniref:Aluminum-activated malate transporter n=1 Tax=Malus domestica TaxID=3750 RepID=A0A498HNN6_MALDO|nr:hypothetical protein DVH24_015649 [Malus domestica]